MNIAAKIGLGSAINRVDGLDKVKGRARYAAEYFADGLLHGAIVSSGIAKGRINAIDERAAREIAGVVEIITQKNRPHVAWRDKNYQDETRRWVRRSALSMTTRFVSADSPSRSLSPKPMKRRATRPPW